MKAWLRQLFDWAGRVGTDAADSPEILLQKHLTVALCVGTLPLTIGWSLIYLCLLYTSPSPRDRTRSRMPSSA